MITSKENEKIKYINSLKNKKFRDKYNKYIIEGIKLVDEYISSEVGNSPEFIVLCKEILLNNQNGDKVYNKVKDLKKLIEVDENVFNYITDTDTPQGILIIIDKKKDDINNLLNAINHNEKIIVLDKVADTGNMGTIIRTCVSFGVKNIICIKGTVDVYSSKVVRSAMGAMNKININYLDYNELKLLIPTLKDCGYKLIATDLKATRFLHEMDLNNKNIYVLGNEANGVSIEIKAMCEDYIKIKMESVQESLNVGIATAILLYDTYVRGEG